MRKLLKGLGIAVVLGLAGVGLYFLCLFYLMRNCNFLSVGGGSC